MKPKLIAVALFGLTASGIALYPAYRDAVALSPLTPLHAPVGPVLQPQPNEHARIDVVFVLDTTGSMGGLIQTAKEKIWSIASTMASAQQSPEIRIGLVAYRDRGDAYVTRRVDLSADLDSVYAKLMDFRADGGGDTPESVNQALYEAVHEMSWSQDAGIYKVVFLVGDAPPKMNYADDVKYPQTLAAARARGIVVNTIQCGQDPSATRYWEQVAQFGEGKYFRVEQAGSAVAIVTPYDDKLARLSAELDSTRLYYGTEKEKMAQALKLEATDKLNAESSASSRARRAVFNASKSGMINFLGEGELVEDVASGRVDLDSIEPSALPESVAAMAPPERQALIEGKAERRRKLQAEVRTLAKKRDSYLKEKVEAAGGAGDSLDDQIYGAVREQGAKMGLRFEADAPAY